LQKRRGVIGSIKLTVPGAVTQMQYWIPIMADVTIQERLAGGVVVLDVNGRISATDQQRTLQLAVVRLLGEGRKRIVINMEHVPYIDSTGLADLVEIIRASQRNGGSLCLSKPSPRVRELLILVKLTSVVEVFDSEEEAVESRRATA
jgi:anti-sigma B factor antagonist